MRIFFMLALASVFIGCGTMDDREYTENNEGLSVPLDDVRVLKVGEVDIDGIIHDQLVYDDGSEAAKNLFEQAKIKGLGTMQHALYQGNCWASRSSGEYRDDDYHAKFNVSANEPYYVYMSAALWAALAAVNKPLVHFREGNKVLVNLGGAGIVFKYSVWVRRTWC